MEQKNFPCVKWCILTAVLFVIVFLLTAATTVVASGSVTLSGTVRDYRGRPVEGVTITVMSPSEARIVSMGISDLQGQFVIDVPPGTYALTVLPPRDSGLQPNLVAPEHITRSTNLDFILLPVRNSVSSSSLSQGREVYTEPSSARRHVIQARYSAERTLAEEDNDEPEPVGISGTVTDSEGTPFAGAKVQVIDPQSGHIVATAHTNAEGSYAVSVEPGIYDVRAIPTYGSGFGTVLALAQDFTSDSTLNLVLVPAGTAVFSGRVVDPTGEGLPGQQICLAPIYTADRTCQTTDSSGNYAFQVPFGEYRIIVIGGSRMTDQPIRAPYDYGLESVYWTPNLRLTQSIVMDIPLPEHKVRVHVQDPQGNPVPNAIVSVQAFLTEVPLGPLPAFGSIGNPSVPTDIDGNADMWLFTSPPNEPYVVFAEPPEGSPYTTNFSLAYIGESTTVTITLSPPITFTGRLLDANGNGVPGQSICMSPGPSGPPVCQTTDSAGHYFFELAPGDYKVMIGGGSSGDSLNVPGSYFLQNRYWEGAFLSLTQNTILDITLPIRRVRVYVQDPTGNPVANARVFTGMVLSTDLTIANLPASGQSYYLPGAPQVTHADGYADLWLFPSSPDEPYTVIADPPLGTSYVRSSITQLHITRDTVVTITLGTPTSLVSLTGRVLDPDGTGLPGQSVCVAPGDTYYVTCQTTDAEGKYVLQLAPGDYSIQVSGFNTDPSINAPVSYLLQSITPMSLTENSSVDITLPMYRVSLRLQEAAGTPIPDIGIAATSGGCDVTIGPVPACGYAMYPLWTPYITTDANGDANLRIFRTPPDEPAIIVAVPPSGSSVAPFHIHHTGPAHDQTIVMALEYVHDPPTTTLELTPSPDQEGIYREPVTVTLSATAAQGYAVAATFYRLDEEETLTYEGPFTVSEEGVHTIEYWSVDNAGVYESPKRVSFQILLNQPPLADPGGPYVVEEGSTVTLDGSRSLDPDGDPLTFAWDLDADGIFEVSGARPIFSAEYVDGPQDITVALQVCDDRGACSTAETLVSVTNAPPSVSTIDIALEAVRVGTDIRVSATFTDPGLLDTHTSAWDWGDGTTSTGSISEANGRGSVTGSHEYGSTGLYTIKLIVTDDDGASGEAVFQFLAVYDPEAGFITGGGWIDSPAGACSLDTCSTDASGRAHFHLTAKYNRESVVPTGKVDLHLEAGNLKFKARQFDWLVIVGSRGYLKGSGTINGEGDYGFLVAAIDAQKTDEEDIDKIRIKIWEKASGHVVYDTQPNAPDNAEPLTPVEEGSIVIHKN